MTTQVEELADDTVRLKVDVPAHDMHHAVEHATSDLAASVKIPGFRPGKVPLQVLKQRLGKERIMAEAVDSHISGWFWNAAARARIRPIAQPQYDYELPDEVTPIGSSRRPSPFSPKSRSSTGPGSRSGSPRPRCPTSSWRRSSMRCGSRSPSSSL